MTSRRADRNEARDTCLRLAELSVYRCPVLWCNKPFIDEKARDRHVAAVHPTFPPPDEFYDAMEEVPPGILSDDVL